MPEMSDKLKAAIERQKESQRRAKEMGNALRQGDTTPEQSRPLPLP